MGSRYPLHPSYSANMPLTHSGSAAILTLNVRGMHTARKRYAVYAYIKRHHAQIAFIQETHLTTTEVAKIHRRWRGIICATTYSAFARGTLIWIRPGVPFREQSRTVDPEGRYALLQGQLDGQTVLLGSIYGPNADQSKFWDTLSTPLSAYAQIPWILGGDYNCVQSLELDRSHPASPVAAQARRFAAWVRHWSHTDIWRARNPTERLYSYYSVPHDLRVRLDCFLCSPAILPLLLDADYLGRTISDHDAHKITLRWRPPAPLSLLGASPENVLMIRSFSRPRLITSVTTS